jgi:hypothetical protein
MERLRGQIVYDQRRVSDGARLLLSRSTPAQPTHLEALGAAIWAADLDSAEGLREPAGGENVSPSDRPRPAPYYRAAARWDDQPLADVDGAGGVHPPAAACARISAGSATAAPTAPI